MLEGTDNEMEDGVVHEAKRKVVGVILCFTGFYMPETLASYVIEKTQMSPEKLATDNCTVPRIVCIAGNGHACFIESGHFCQFNGLAVNWNFFL